MTYRYEIRHFINNEFVHSVAEGTFETLNPATNRPIGVVADGQPEDVDRAVKAARKAFDDGPWPKMNAEARSKKLRKIADLIEKYADEIAEREIADCGVPIRQIKGGAIPRAAYNFNYFADMTYRVTGESYPVGDQFINYSIRRPVGVAGLITPWNVPFMLETWKVAPCLAFGNTCILKPAEWSPLSADMLARIVQEADLPPGVFNIVHGFGETAGAPIVAHPGVQVISFTGETTTGQIIMRNGASTLKRYSMELGGKSPTIVFEDADVERALDGTIFQIYSLNGERCTAGSRLILQESIYDTFVEELASRVAKIKVGPPEDPATEVGPLIHPEHWEKVNGYMDVARAEGATIRVGGVRPEGFPEGNYFSPTLIVDVRNDMRITQEEIFGPVLVVVPFKDETEAIRFANDVRYGLAGYVWTQDIGRGHRVAQAIESGMVWINSHNVRDLRMPFGGSKHSGIGREGDHYSFELYTEIKAIHVALGTHHIPKMGATDVSRNE
ncbi:MAG TPA: 5-carboxymethyl-2-hydroxymuconate semialdehyde dehydrogenase [Anaerolineae bacterium]|nr:5-carboxymethyl-2-hydroxymuconate semialdehyde dehydrogenase [Anaerolineae bacterium]